MQSDYLKTLEKQHYKIFGKNKHSAAKLCLWTKKSLKMREFVTKRSFMVSKATVVFR